jgi:tetratricopeptide (TPR) repeat protein
MAMEKLRRSWVLSLVLGTLIVGLPARYGIAAVGEDLADPSGLQRNRGEYLRVLEILCEEGSEVALTSLLALESTVDNSGAPSQLGGLRRAYLAVAELLIFSGPSLLLPLIDLHESSYLYHLQHESWHAAYHSRSTMYALSNEFADSADAVNRKSLASDLFASLAGYFHADSSFRTASKLYSRALQMDATHEAALLGIATLFEQQGRYSQALSHLEDLVGAHPDNLEARLRLAINWQRSGRIPEAIEVFDSVIQESEPDWIIRLGFQELARLRLQESDLERSRAILEAGIDRFPDDPSLVIGYQYIWERADLEFDPAALQSALELCSHNCRPSARFRYASFDPQFLESLRQELRHQASKTLPALQRALASEGPQLAN